MSDWHGYPQAPMAHPKRPWWVDGSRRDGWSVWRASLLRPKPKMRRIIVESEEAVEAEIARIDREHPLPAPPPRCGQVWVWLDGDGDWFPYRFEMLVIGVDHNGRACWANNPIGILSGGPWPPPGAVLVAGPGAPWAPPEWEPEDNSG